MPYRKRKKAIAAARARNPDREVETLQQDEVEPVRAEPRLKAGTFKKGSRKKQPSMAMNIRLPASLHRAIIEMSKARGVPMSSLIILWLWEGIGPTDWAPPSAAPRTGDTAGHEGDDC